jgi:hypothetical protein
MRSYLKAIRTCKTKYPKLLLGILCISSILVLVSGCRDSGDISNEIIDLSGKWSFQLDPDNVGMKDHWYNKEFRDSLTLPGTTDENEKGIFLDEQATDRLSRVWYWKGAVWYQRDIFVPEEWEGKNIQLLLERAKDSYVWLDDASCGYENSLSAFQVFDLTKAVSPGKHRITVLIDNSKLPPVGPSHAVDERTQTNWNGIIGRIELQVSDPVWMDEVQAYPDIENNRVKIRVNIKNITDTDADGELIVRAESRNTSQPVKFKSKRLQVSGISGQTTVEFFYNFNREAPLWNEFDPALIQLNLNLSTTNGIGKYSSSKKLDFGMREFKREGKHLTINGKRVFLRGRLDCANYPLTGYPPMEKSDWLKLFSQLKSYGINHWRFHSWCPPQAAFTAADEIGVYLQPELPNKRSGMDNRSMDEELVRALYNVDYLQIDTSKVNMTLKDYLEREGELIFKYFGNHPSFTMFTLGNELGRNEAMFNLISHFKEIDPRRLYAQGSGNMHWDPSFADGDDFWVTSKTTPELPTRSSYFVGDFENAPIETYPPSTLFDYSLSIAHVPAPVIGHETGQYQVSPDFTDIPKFTGVTRARNYEIFMRDLEQANMLDQSTDFVKASGKLAVICYREDIETALRTSDFGGFQLLDLQDFPGQGTALVGILNDFMEPKGFTSPEEWSQFCSEVVPLLRMSKYTWTNNERFEGKIELAHYGQEDFIDATIRWKLVDGADNTLYEGDFSDLYLPQGGLAEVGSIRVGLESIQSAEQLKIIITLDGTRYRNEYDIWVYPQKIDTGKPEDLLVTDNFDSSTREHLLAGGRAIIIPDHDKLRHCINGAFQTDFWCYPMFARAAINRGIEPAPGSLGFICDPNHPLLKHFPTEFHSNWQWWHLVKNCKPIILDETPAEYKPLIQTIDNFSRNHKLGMVFETRYGKGKALICAIDLLNLQDKPEARQLYYSLLKYVESDQFSPDFELRSELLTKILP